MGSQKMIHFTNLEESSAKGTRSHSFVDKREKNTAEPIET